MLKRLLIVLFLPISLCAAPHDYGGAYAHPKIPKPRIVELPDPGQTHTMAALDTNNAFTGNNTFKNFETVLYADNFSGSDICAQINAALAALPSAGGIVNAQAFLGDNSCTSATIVLGNGTSNVTLVLPQGRIISSTLNPIIKCTAGSTCFLVGQGNPSVTFGGGTTEIVNNGSANDAVDWFGSYGVIRDFGISSNNSTGGIGLLIKALGTSQASHNQISNVGLAGPGKAVSGVAGLVLSADTSSALACCNEFHGVSVQAFADGEKLVTTNNQGPTDNWFYASYIFNNGNGINIQKGDVNGWLGGIVSSNTTGINIIAGPSFNSFYLRAESNTAACNSAGTGGWFQISLDAATCTINARAHGDSVLGNGNVATFQRLQNSLLLPSAGALGFDGDTGVSRCGAGVTCVGNSNPGDVSGSLKAAAYLTGTRCNPGSSVSPAPCGSAASGTVVVPTTTTTYTVSTTAVTANSDITVTPITDATGLTGGPTCTAPPTPFIGYVSGRVAGTSFTFTLPRTTGASCWTYWIRN